MSHVGHGGNRRRCGGWIGAGGVIHRGALIRPPGSGRGGRQRCGRKADSREFMAGAPIRPDCSLWPIDQVSKLTCDILLSWRPGSARRFVAMGGRRLLWKSAPRVPSLTAQRGTGYMSERVHSRGAHRSSGSGAGGHAVSLQVEQSPGINNFIQKDYHNS